MCPHIFIAINVVFTVQYIQLSRNKITEGFKDRLFTWDIMCAWENGFRQLFTPTFRCNL